MLNGYHRRDKDAAENEQNHAFDDGLQQERSVIFADEPSEGTNASSSRRGLEKLYPRR